MSCLFIHIFAELGMFQNIGIVSLDIRNLNRKTHLVHYTLMLYVHKVWSCTAVVMVFDPFLGSLSLRNPVICDFHLNLILSWVFHVPLLLSTRPCISLAWLVFFYRIYWITNYFHSLFLVGTRYIISNTCPNSLLQFSYNIQLQLNINHF